MIPEEMIMRHLDMLLTGSEPGATLHHLHVVAAPRGAIGPLGMPDPDKLHTSVYAIAPTEDVNVNEFVTKVVRMAGVEAFRHAAVPLFAAMAWEAWAVISTPGTGRDALADELLRANRLPDHPTAAEVTMTYGVCRDGRRWHGRRWLTGPKAGTSEDISLLVGRPAAGEGYGIPAARAMRALVGVGG